MPGLSSPLETSHMPHFGSKRIALLACLFGLMSIATPVSAQSPEPLPKGNADDHAHAFAAEDDLERMMASSGILAPFFNESAGCSAPAGIETPHSTTNSSSNRNLPSGHQVRGPWGDFYGRDRPEVEGSLVNWTVPMSGGTVVKVHERALPAFLQVSDNLAVEKNKGRHYEGRRLASFVWRRIGGSYRMSTHAFGSTIDINWDTNPYRADNVLITDMPAWYVAAWTEAGFCWGGDWKNIKDPMHFAWKGPIATEGYGPVPAPYPPNTAVGNYSTAAFTGTATFGAIDGQHSFYFTDANRDAAPDVIRLGDWGDDDLLLEFARSSRDLGRCGVGTYRVHGLQDRGDRFLVADHDSDGRPDVWAVEEDTATVRLEISTFASDFEDIAVVDTGAVAPASGDYAVADYDRDGHTDLFVIDRNAGGSVKLEIWSGDTDYATLLLGATTQLDDAGDEAATRFALGDHDVDGIPDVYAIRVGGSVGMEVIDGSSGFTGSPMSLSTSAAADTGGEYGLGDYDGDGRPDLLSLESDGMMSVFLGGVQTGDPNFWFQPASWQCHAFFSPSLPWDYNGDQFADLTIGSPGEDFTGAPDTGLAHTLGGSTGGAGANGGDLWHQNLPPK